MNDRKARRRRRSSNGFVDILNGLLTLLVLGLAGCRRRLSSMAPPSSMAMARSTEPKPPSASKPAPAWRPSADAPRRAGAHLQPLHLPAGRPPRRTQRRHQGRRFPHSRRRQHGRHPEGTDRGRSDPLCRDHPRGLDLLGGRPAPQWRQRPRRRSLDPAGRRLDPARQLRLRPRRHPPVRARQDAGRHDHRTGRRLGRPRPRPADRNTRSSCWSWPRSSKRKPASPASARRLPPSSSIACAKACACSPIRPSSMASPRASRRSAAACAAPRSRRRRPTTPTRSMACRRRRSPIRASRRSRPSPIPTTTTTSTSSPRAHCPAKATSSPRPMPSIRTTSRAIARSPTKPPHRRARTLEDAAGRKPRGRRRPGHAVSQSLASMTGYARATGAVPGASFACEVKSVNGRGLDIRLRLAPGFDALEGDIRQLIGKMISRGSLTFNLSVERDGAGGDLLVNRQALATVLAAIDDLSGKVAAAPPSLDGILGLKGVLEQRDQPHVRRGRRSARIAAILDGASQALVDLVLARRQEGNQIAAILLDRLRRDRDPGGSAPRPIPPAAATSSSPACASRSPPSPTTSPFPKSASPRRPCCWPPRPISARNSTAWSPTSPAPASSSAAVAPSAAGSISWPRNSTARPIRCAANPMPWSSPPSALTSRRRSINYASKCRTSNRIWLMEFQRRGVMLVIASPSGAGKSSISRSLFGQDPNIRLSVSVTTRARRTDEVEGTHYYFVDVPDLQAHEGRWRAARMGPGARQFLRHPARQGRRTAGRRQRHPLRHRLSGHAAALRKEPQGHGDGVHPAAHHQRTARPPRAPRPGQRRHHRKAPAQRPRRDAALFANTTTSSSTKTSKPRPRRSAPSSPPPACARAPPI